MKTEEFDIKVPPELIAQEPVSPRDHSRLLRINRDTKEVLDESCFFDLPGLLRPSDILVFNDSRVIPARLRGNKEANPMEVVTVLLLNEQTPSRWEALTEAGVVEEGEVLLFEKGVKGRVISKGERIGRRQETLIQIEIEGNIEKAGEPPIPPYVHGYKGDPEKYQTVYSKIQGSAAAPTAGLHFTNKLLEEIQQKGITFAFVTLHVGVDTFMPIYEEDPRDHKMYTEYYFMPLETYDLICSAKYEKRRIICVGTTSTRTIETVFTKIEENPKVVPYRLLQGNTDIYIYPGYRWKMVDGMITNFHYPRSTNLVMVSAFAGQELIRDAYKKAVEWKYRFYSFGDSCLIL